VNGVGHGRPLHVILYVKCSMSVLCGLVQISYKDHVVELICFF